jgi:DNA polymerase III subunit delta'
VTVWDDLIGQDDAIAVLQHAAAAARVIAAGGEQPATLASAMTHAWLFTGPAGSGRSVAARAFAAALQCEREPAGCGECSACHTVATRSHPDVHSVVPEGLSISVAEMRAVVARSARRPVLGKWQVILLEDADRLTEPAANALLKMVEEPPPRTVVLLCVPSLHPDDVLPTIRSRCRLVSLRTPPAEAISAVLQERDGIDAATADWAAAASQGHVGRARRLARDEAAQEHRAAVLAIPASLTSMAACLAAAERLVAAAEAEAKDLSESLDARESEALQVALGAGGTGKGTAAAPRGTAGVLKDLEKRQKSRQTRTQRDALDRALVDLAAFYRDVLLVQSRSAIAPAHPDFDDDVRAVALKLRSPDVLRRLDAVLECRSALELNVKPRIAVEAMTAALRLPS